MTQTKQSELLCIQCAKSYDWRQVIYVCPCGGLLELKHHHLKTLTTKLFDDRIRSRAPLDRSGVWRFREAVLPLAEAEIISHPEGGTHLYERAQLNAWAGGVSIKFKHEGENPTGSFKDRGMTVAISQAKALGQKAVACASTGNTSAALAAYAAQASLRSLVFLPSGKVAAGKIAQAIGYGATCLAIDGDFDRAMELVMSVRDLGVYLVNSVNPLRLEGQKTIIWELFQDMEWQAPDWIVVPGGNLGNTTAFGKAIHEAYEAGWITKKPRIATIQSAGANPFYLSFKKGFKEFHATKADTMATAINIGNPVNYAKAKRVMESLNGIVEEVSDAEIIAAKQAIDGSGLGCEPASAATLAGVKKMLASGVLKSHESVVCVLTGHMLKDTEAVMRHSPNKITSIAGTIEAVTKYI